MILKKGDETMNLSERIYILRKQSGFSQEELAEKLGVTRQAVSKWESQQSTPDMDNIIAISKLFNVTTDYLLIGKENNSNSETIKNENIFSRVINNDLLKENIFINVIIHFALIFISVLVGVFSDFENGVLFLFFGELFFICLVAVFGIYLKSKKKSVKNLIRVSGNFFLVIFSVVSFLFIEELNYGDTTLFLHFGICLAVIALFNILVERKKFKNVSPVAVVFVLFFLVLLVLMIICGMWW